jgi:hypothetical protein
VALILGVAAWGEDDGAVGEGEAGVASSLCCERM